MISQDEFELKNRFFAQYWGQQICGYDSSKNDFVRVSTLLRSFEKTDTWCLFLKPLSKITDEDANELQYTLVNVIGIDGLIKENSIELVRELVSNYEKADCLGMLPSSFTDKARKLGYAIDWDRFKVSQLIANRWVKLI